MNWNRTHSVFEQGNWSFHGRNENTKIEKVTIPFSED